MRETPVRYALLGVLALVAAVYLPALAGDWVYDDRVLIEGNPKLHGLANLWQQIAEPFWGPELGYWRPLTSVLISAGYMLGGGGTLALHALALGVHLAAVAAVFALTRRLLGEPRAALLVALLFGLHPVQVEGVAWIAAINDPLQGLFALLAMTAWWRWRAGGSQGRPWRAVGCFAAGVLCKETGLMILPMLVLLDATQRQAWPTLGGTAARAYAPLLAVVALYFGARMLVFEELTAGLGRTWTDPSLSGGRWLSLPVEMAGRFVELLAVPWPLTVFRSVAPPEQLLSSGVFLRAVLWCVLFIVAGAFALRRRWRVAQLGLGLVLLSIAPTIARVQSLGAYPIADRYLYVAVFGWSALLVGAVLRARAATVGILALAVVYGIASHRQIDVWRNQESLVRHGVARNPGDPIVQFMLGELLLQRYRTTNDSGDLRDARAAFAAADTAPDQINDAGQVYVLRQKHEVRLGLAWCLFYERQASGGERFDDVVARFEAVVASSPEVARAWIGLGVACATAGDFDRAERSLLRAVELDPRSAEAHYNLGYFYATLKRLDVARGHLQEALRINPGDVAARNLLEQMR